MHVSKLFQSIKMSKDLKLKKINASLLSMVSPESINILNSCEDLRTIFTFH
jgi:hypothetical protein